MRVSRRFWLVAAGAVALVAVLLVVFVAAPAWARKKAIAAARARGIELTIGRARVGLTRVELHDVWATLEGVPDLVVHAGVVGARWSFSGVGDLDVRGVEIDARGRPDELKAAVDAWKQRHPSAPSSGPKRARAIVLRDVTAHWKILGVELGRGRAEEVAVGETRVSIRGGSVTARVPGVEASASGVTTEISRETGKLGALTVATALLKLGGGADLALPTAALALESVPAAPEPQGEPSPWRAVERARGAIEKVAARFEPGVEVRFAEVSVATDRGTLGPWGARAVLGTDALSFELDPGEKAGRKPLVLRALVPRSRGKWSAELKMGPATLAELGVAEGALGLADVGTANVEARGAIELDPDEKTFAADASVTLKNASLADARIADGTVQGIDLSAKGVVASRDDLSVWSLTGGSIELGKVRLDLEGGAEAPKGKDGKRVPKVWLAWTVPVVPCGDALASMPKGLLPKLEGMQMTGTFGAHGRFAFDARVLEKTQVELFLEQKCKVTKAPPAVSVDRFREPFELRVYDPKGNPRWARFGPGTAEWVRYEKISPHVADAISVCEDGAFWVHNGFSAGAIRNAILANIKAGKFVMGASTVTMQLAKNVFLDRRKQLSRKLQEAVLTMWLEQAMTKSEILELYLNVIEYGPNVYGIGPASWHYFGRPASDLDPLEATFLISLLPAPVKRHFMWEKGQVPDGYMQYLKTLLKEQHARGKLDDDEYQAAIGRTLTFHKPGEPLPPPHGIQPVKGPVDKSGIDDSAFDPVWAPSD